MKVSIRRVGNSLGIIVPKPVLEAWGVGEGDRLELTERGLRPAARPGLRHEALDELKRSIALAVVRQFAPREIRAQILANLHRWRRQGAWVSAYDEWRDIATRGDDGELFAASFMFLSPLGERLGEGGQREGCLLITAAPERPLQRQGLVFVIDCWPARSNLRHGRAARAYSC